MKKVFLLLSALVMTVTAAMADTTLFDFEGTGDVYGLTRGGGETANSGYAMLTYVNDISIEQAGVSVKATATKDDAFALAKYNNNAAYDGLFVKAYAVPTFTITIPNGGVITSVKFTIGRQSLSTASAENFLSNGKAMDEGDAIIVQSYIIQFPWSDSKGVDAYTFSWNSSWAPTYIHKIEVTYTRDLGGKEEAGLAFKTTEIDGIMGQPFTAPALTNPNNLPITWSSSNEAAATVNSNGDVTFVGAGTTYITASTVGDATHADGSASYALQVIPSANSLAELAGLAPNSGDKVYFNFPITVTLANHADAWVIDAQNNAAKIHNTIYDGETSAQPTYYKVGEVIPAGWIATDKIERNLSQKIWSGLPAAVTETVPVVYPVVKNFNFKEDCFRVVVLNGVEFENGFVGGGDVKNWGKWNGESYQFQDTFAVGSKSAGTYNVTVAIDYNEKQGTPMAYLYPIKFEEPAADVKVPATSELVVAVSGEGTAEYDENLEAIVVKTTTKEDNAVVTLTVPEGFDNFVYLDMTAMIGANAAAQAEESEWVAVSELTANGFTLGNEITVPADGKDHMIGSYLVKGDQAYQAAGYNFVVTATKEVSGPATKTVTFDFVNETYDMTLNGAFKANAKMCEYEGVILTNGSSTTTKRQTAGLYLDVWPASISISSISGPVTEVTYTLAKEINISVTYNDGVAVLQNQEDFDRTNIQTLTVTFEDDGMSNADIAYPAKTLELVNGVGEFKGLVLENPNNLTVTYTSSNSDVIVNENGEISLAEGVKAASSTITATFEGNDKYRPATVSYELEVIGAANTLAELKELAGASNKKAYVNFPVVVAYSNGTFAFVQSLDGTEATEIYQSSIATTYPEGAIIPQGWTATATLSNGFLRYAMSTKPESVQTQEPKIETVSVITAEDVTKVMILKGVEVTEDFITKFPKSNTFSGAFDYTVGEGTYNIYNQFKIDAPEVGTYDMKTAVMLYSGAVRLYPIEFMEPTADPDPQPVQGTVTYDFLTNDYGFGRSATTYIATGTIIPEGDAKLTLTKGSGNGFRMWTDGMRVYKGNDNIMTVAIEGAQITKIEMKSKQTSLGTVTFNGETVSAANNLYTWTGDSESVAINITPASTVAVESIVIEYTQLSGAKEAAELSFPAAEFTVGQNEAFTKGKLTNPHELPVTWTSSNEEVATVTEDGQIVIKGLGTTVITATTAETDVYEAGEASYKLTVVAAATTIPQMIEKAPNKGDEILMNGTLYVAYANGQYVYVYDLYDNATLLYGANSFVTGDVIPGGWVAKNATYNGLLEWSGNYPAATQNFAEYVEYPVVESLTTADVNRVVTIPNVEFTDNTPANGKSVSITLPDGSSVDLYNKFNLAQEAEGKYDVVAAVTIYNNKLQVYPIEYKATSTALVYPTQFDVTTSFEGAEVTQKVAGDGSLQINVVAEKVPTDTFTTTIAVPEGWTAIMMMSDDTNVTIGSGVAPQKRANSAVWVPVSQLEMYGYEMGNSFTVAVKKETPAFNSYSAEIILVKDDQGDYANSASLTVKVNKDMADGVEAIEAAEEARFFTLDGVEVANPEKGVYIKVVDGKATKVVIR